MNECKYVILEGRFPVLLSCQVVHSELARSKPTSAGFCRIGVDDGRIKVVCFGRSKSLGLGFSPADEELIERMLNG